jgi:hypothetical protein
LGGIALVGAHRLLLRRQLGIEVADKHARTLGRERFRGRQADAAGAAS